MVRPKVSPPRPHMAPQNHVHANVEAEVSPSTPRRSLVLIEARTQGAMIQLKKPPTSQ